MKRSVKSFKIGMILDHQFPPDPRVENEALALIASGFSVTLFSLHFGGRPSIETIQNIMVRRAYIPRFFFKKFRPLINTFPFYRWFLISRFHRMLKENPVDVLHVHDLHLGSVGLRLARQHHLPLVLDLHENYIAAMKSYGFYQTRLGKLLIRIKKWERYEREILPKMDRIVVLSAEYRDKLLGEHPLLKKENMLVVPNGVRLDPFEAFAERQELIPDDGSFYLIYIGVIATRRGIDTALDALRLVIHDHPKFKLVLAGRIDLQEAPYFESQFHDPALQNHIINLGFKPPEELMSLIGRCNAGLSPIVKNDQHESGIANKVYQYMAMGKPIIVSDCRPQQVLAETTESGLVFESGNPNALRDCIAILMDHPEMCKKMGENGRRAVQTTYNWQQTGRPLIELYETLEHDLQHKETV